jgi:glycosyltransferase involved in cell wall biosynthesis
MMNYEFPPIGGGAANAHLRLLNEYKNHKELNVDVLTSAPDPRFVHESFSDNINIYRIGLHKKSLHFWRKIEVLEWLVKANRFYRKRIRDYDYNLIHAFFGFPTGWLCYRTANEIPYLISLRGSDVPGLNPRLKLDYKLLKPLFKSIWKKAALLVACSQGLKQRALSFLPSVPIEVIVNGVESDRFFPAASVKIQNRLNLLTVGRLSATKRIDMLIDTVECLKKEGLNPHLTVVGDGALANQLKKFVLYRDLSDNISMNGRIESEQMPEIYQKNHVYISATMQEGMSNAMLEAMATGLPIVTTACEGIDELIADNGIIVKQHDAKSIAAAIKKLSSDAMLYKKMSLSARKRAEQFSWKKVADTYLCCYNEILNS